VLKGVTVQRAAVVLLAGRQGGTAWERAEGFREDVADESRWFPRLATTRRWGRVGSASPTACRTGVRVRLKNQADDQEFTCSCGEAGCRPPRFRVGTHPIPHRGR